MSGYTKLFTSIINSTIWREEKETKILWITMLAMADKNGIVEASVPGLADMARITVEECEIALRKLSAPDPYSRTKEHDGRRIATVDGGWHLLNHAKYRAKLNADERREYLREKKAESRARERQSPVNKRHVLSTGSTHAKAEANPEADPEAAIQKSGVLQKLPHGEQFAAKWVEWLEYRRSLGLKKLPSVSIQRQIAKLGSETERDAIECIENSIRNGWQGLFPNKSTGRKEPTGIRRAKETLNNGATFLPRVEPDDGILF